MTLLMTLAGALGIAALGPRYGGEVTVGVLDLPSSRAPDVPRGVGARLLSALVHETLLGIDMGGFPTPGLAEGWSSAAAGREWTLSLSPDARFHDGHRVRAEHVVRSLQRFLRSDSAAAAVLSSAVEGGKLFAERETESLPGLLAPDPLRVVLRFEENRTLPFAPLAAAAAAVTGARGVGCGPFVPTLPVADGTGLVLTAFPGHSRGRPYLDRVRVLGIPDIDDLAASFQAGRVQVAPLGTAASSLAATLMLQLDPSRPPFDTRASRSVVAAAVDRIGLVRHFLHQGEATFSLLPPSLLAPLESRNLPEAASVPGSITLAVARDVPRPASRRVVAHLAALGLDVKVSPVDGASVQRAGSHAQLFVWIPEVPEAGLALRELQRLSPTPPGVRETLSAAEREPNADGRRRLLHRAQRALTEHACLIPLASVGVSIAAQPGLHGLRVDVGGRLILEDTWIEPGVFSGS